jgi:hypothetical protein
VEGGSNGGLYKMSRVAFQTQGGRTPIPFEGGKHVSDGSPPLFAPGAGFLKGRCLATPLKSSVYRHFDSGPQLAPFPAQTWSRRGPLHFVLCRPELPCPNQLDGSSACF